jgi:L-malate glycosyltransferase
MRILLLADTKSEHTERWALSLAKRGLHVGLFSFNKSSYDWYSNNDNVKLLFEPTDSISGFGLKEKLNYFTYLPILKKIIQEFKPDMLHAHYASSYGLIGALSKFKPFVISVWGADVYDFPQSSIINKIILKYILSKATHICSTSICMQKETGIYTKKEITVIPFGIDINVFRRGDEDIIFSHPNKIIIGNIKPLETKYGIDTLIHAFSKLIVIYPNKQMKLLLVGEGSEIDHYKKLCESLNINDKVIFTGRVPFKDISLYHKKIDIFISLSRLDSESFGVSLVEAMSSASCVIASNVAGFNEVLGGNNECGFLVSKDAIDEAVEAIRQCIENPEIARQKAQKARLRAIQLYNWENNVEEQINVYYKVLKQNT